MHTEEAVGILGSASHTSEAQIANNLCRNCQSVTDSFFENQVLANFVLMQLPY
jgi:hypothetical protein